ncbi:hypothetical protein EW639_09545 [Porphyromonas gingivalis]|nr:hypothetical protein EW639_09545 [Porphyromonas gingivalis]
MGVTFYTSRVILAALGEIDFGIYNVVGGMALMFAFFSSSLSNATQRFLNIALGKKDVEEANRVFSLSQTSFLLLSLLVLVIAELIGFWFIYNKLVIPTDRLDAALWVFHATVISLFFTVNGIVFNSVLIARENFKVYAYIGIFEALAKLAIALALSFTDSDRLKLYSSLYVGMTIVVQLFYAAYCICKYEECRVRLYWDKKMFVQLSSFIGWNTFGTAVWTLNSQGINVLINMFFGLSVNAARAVSAQVETGLGQLNLGFITAVKPQVVKVYAAQKYTEFIQLLFDSTRHSFILMWLIGFPVMLNRDFILRFWLVNVPQGTADFVLWAIIAMIINAFTFPIWNAIQAVGKLGKYTIVSNGVYLLVFPISFFAFELGASAIVFLQIMSLVRIVQVMSILFVLKGYLDFSLKAYVHSVLSPVLQVILFSSLVCFLSRYLFSSPWILVLFDGIIVSLIIIARGLSAQEHRFLLTKLQTIIYRK